MNRYLFWLTELLCITEHLIKIRWKKLISETELGNINCGNTRNSIGLYKKVIDWFW